MVVVVTYADQVQSNQAVRRVLVASFLLKHALQIAVLCILASQTCKRYSSRARQFAIFNGFVDHLTSAATLM
jgi:hypothetical protein